MANTPTAAHDAPNKLVPSAPCGGDRRHGREHLPPPASHRPTIKHNGGWSVHGIRMGRQGARHCPALPAHAERTKRADLGGRSTRLPPAPSGTGSRRRHVCRLLRGHDRRLPNAPRQLGHAGRSVPLHPHGVSDMRLGRPTLSEPEVPAVSSSATPQHGHAPLSAIGGPAPLI